MAKTIVEELLEGLSPDVQAAVKAAVASRPQLAVRDRQMGELFSIYMNEEPAAGAAVAGGAGGAAGAGDHPPIIPPTTVNSPTTPADNPVMAELSKLNTSLDTRLKTIEDQIAKFPTVRTEILTSAIKLADNYSTVREQHRQEFGETLDRKSFEKFVADQAAAGIRYADDPADAPTARTGLQKAHDQFVAAKRTASEIQKGINEGLKTRKSGTEVPGQTQSQALSPAQAVLAKARESAGGGSKSNALAAADRMAAMIRQRDEASAGTVQ